MLSLYILLDMPSTRTTGVHRLHLLSPSPMTSAFAKSLRLGTPRLPIIRFRRAEGFRGSLVRFRYGLSSCSSPWRI